MQMSSQTATQPAIAKGEDEAKIKSELNALLETEWKLNDEQIQLEKTYYFKAYTKVLVRNEQRTRTCAKFN